MARLVYDNIFESIEPSKKKAARMQAASHAIIDLRDILEERGMRPKKIKAICDAVFERTFSRFR